MFLLRKKINSIILISLVNKYTGAIFETILRKVLNQNKINSLNIDGIKIEQIYDTYNLTYLNERTIEIPLAKYFLKKYLSKLKTSKILEIGNTLIHYDKDNSINRIILDKYEKYQNVINEDITEYSPNNKFDLIFSISTLEHVGSDYGETIEQEKFLKALDKINNLLTENGVFIVTLPIFYRDEIDKFIFNNNDFESSYFLLRQNFKNDWKLSNKEYLRNNRNAYDYNSKYPCANALFIGIMRKK